MFREPKPSRAFTSAGKRTSSGTSSGAQLRGDGIPFSTKNRCASSLSDIRTDASSSGSSTQRGGEPVALAREHREVEVVQRDDEADVVLVPEPRERRARTPDPRCAGR